MRRTLGAAIVLVIFAAGCAQGPASSGDPERAPSTMSPVHAVVNAWADEVAEHRSAIDEVVQTLDAHSCVGDGLAHQAVCSATFVDGRRYAQALAEELRSAGDDDSPDFVGGPPPQVFDLVMGTIDAAVYADAATAAWLEGSCVMTSDVGCRQLAARSVQAFAGLRAAVEAWSPYL